MRKILCFLGTVIYGCISSYLLWLLSYWIVPYFMDLNWFWGIVTSIFFPTILMGLFVSILSLVLVPLVMMISVCNWFKYIPIPFILFFGYSAVKLPWTLDIEYGTLQITLGVIATIEIALMFIGSIGCLFQDVNKK